MGCSLSLVFQCTERITIVIRVHFLRRASIGANPVSMAIRRKPQPFCILFLYIYIYIYIYKQCLFILIEESWLFMTQKLKLKP